MEKLNTFIFLLIVVLIASLVSFLARKRGRSPVVWFFAGLFFGWISLIFLYLLADESVDQNTEERRSGNEEIYKSDEALSGSKEEKELVVTIDQPTVSEKELHGWYYLNKEGLQQGPVELKELKEFFNGGQIYATTYVWHEGMVDWKKIEGLPWLKTELGV